MHFLCFWGGLFSAYEKVLQLNLTLCRKKLPHNNLIVLVSVGSSPHSG